MSPQQTVRQEAHELRYVWVPGLGEAGGRALRAQFPPGTPWWSACAPSGFNKRSGSFEGAWCQDVTFSNRIKWEINSLGHDKVTLGIFLLLKRLTIFFTELTVYIIILCPKLSKNTVFFSLQFQNAVDCRSVWKLLCRFFLSVSACSFLSSKLNIRMHMMWIELNSNNYSQSCWKKKHHPFLQANWQAQNKCLPLYPGLRTSFQSVEHFLKTSRSSIILIRHICWV